jgi:hypothetical protein
VVGVLAAGLGFSPGQARWRLLLLQSLCWRRRKTCCRRDHNALLELSSCFWHCCSSRRAQSGPQRVGCVGPLCVRCKTALCVPFRLHWQMQLPPVVANMRCTSGQAYVYPLGTSVYKLQAAATARLHEPYAALCLYLMPRLAHCVA